MIRSCAGIRVANGISAPYGDAARYSARRRRQNYVPPSSHHYQYITHSDAEVILSFYDRFGTDCVKHLDGMFPFFPCDERRGTFMAAGYRFGINPLYYLQDGDNWYFASEAKAFLGLALPIDPRGARTAQADMHRINAVVIARTIVRVGRRCMR